MRKEGYEQCVTKAEDLTIHLLHVTENFCRPIAKGSVPHSEDILRNKYAGKDLIRVTVGPEGTSAETKRFVFEGVDTKTAASQPVGAGAETT